MESLLPSSLEYQAAVLVLLVAAGTAGFCIGVWFRGERLRQAEWRIRRAERMCGSLRKLSDEYRRRLSGRSPQQAEKKLKDQERKLALLRFQVANLGNELKALRSGAPAPEPVATIDMSEIGGSRFSALDKQP